MERRNLTILCFSDFHAWAAEEIDRIKDFSYDICFLLGDIERDALRYIKNTVKPGTPMYGVQGNHDDWDIFQKTAFEMAMESDEMSLENDIKDLNFSSISYKGYVFYGIGGATRYKNGNSAMLTQNEYTDVLKKRGEFEGNVDVLISHDTMYKLFSKDDPAHIGVKGITKFIKNKRVKLNICGHHHKNVHIRKHGCDIVCIYRCSLITLPDMTVENLF